MNPALKLSKLLFHFKSLRGIFSKKICTRISPMNIVIADWTHSAKNDPTQLFSDLTFKYTVKTEEMRAFSRLLRLEYLRYKVSPHFVKNFKCQFRNVCMYKTVLGPTMFATTFYNMNSDKHDDNSFMKSSREMEEEIMNKVFESPEPELLELMDVLEKCIVESCSQYRICMRKQIEIIEESLKTGIFSDYLDQLPEYRTLACDLNHELNNYVVLLKTVGEMTYQHLMSSAKGESLKDVNLISSKYKDLEVLLQKQLDENRKLETELNNANRNMIMNTKTN